jgi:hypothetical protein
MAWSVPVVVASAATPAAAASAVTPCPTGLWGGTWTISRTNVNTAPTGWSGSTLTNLADSNSTSVSGVVTVSKTLSVTAGRVYGMNFLIQTAQGCIIGSLGTNQNTRATDFFIEVTSGSTTTTLFSGNTGDQVTGGSVSDGVGTYIEPPQTCNSTGNSTWGANGVQNGVVSVNANYVATTTGTVTVRFRFVMKTTTQGNNDDVRITPSFTTCLG